MITLTIEQRDKLVETYVNNVVDDMDMKCLIHVACETLEEGLKNETDQDLINTIEEIYPHLTEALK